MRITYLLCLAIICISLCSCLPGPSSRLYKPVSDWESYAFGKADRLIFPDDVRNNPTAHDSSRVAWPGIIQSTEIARTDSTIEITFEIEHHYYDWIEDFSIQQERIFLSPQGEGPLKTVWTVKPTADTTEILNSVGDMIIVYGFPTDIVDSVISVNAFYVRVIDEIWFATDIMDYGRPGEPINVLRIP